MKQLNETDHRRIITHRQHGYNATRAAALVCLAAVLAANQPSAQPLTLEQAIREACVESDSVKMMKESLIKSEQMVREKRANAFPVIAATGGVAHNYGSAFGGSSTSSSGSSSLAKEKASPDSDAPVTHSELAAMMSGFSDLSGPTHSDIYSCGVSINQPLYTFGKISNAIKVARNFNSSARSLYRRNLQTLQLGTLDLFYQALIAGKAAELAAQSLTRKKDLYLFTERNFLGGAGGRAQVLQLKADMMDQNAKLIIARRDAETVRMYLNMATGRALTDSAALDTAALHDGLERIPVPSPGEAVGEALTNREDIRSIKYLAESNRGGARIMKTLYYPTIGANGSVGYSKLESENSMFSADGNPNWMLGIGIQWTLFDGFKNSARGAQYLSDARKLETAASTMEKATEIEIRSAINECAAADSNETAMREMLAAAGEGYQLSKTEFEQGSGKLVELQQAEELLRQAALGVVNARYRVIRSRAALLVDRGRFIVPMEERE